MKPWLALIPVLALLVLIFGFSAQTAEESSQLSGSLAEQVLTLLYPGYAGLPKSVRLPMENLWESRLRTCAHFSEYMALGFFLCNFLRTLRAKFRTEKDRIFILTAWGTATLIACVDEWFQHFQSGRATQLSDVLTDSVGALCGALLLTLLALLLRGRHHHQRKGN